MNELSTVGPIPAMLGTCFSYFCTYAFNGRRFGVVVTSFVASRKLLSLRQARLVLGWVTVTVFGRVYHLGSRYVASKLGQLSLESPNGRQFPQNRIPALIAWQKVGWKVTLCGPVPCIWYMKIPRSRGSEAGCKLLHSVY